MTEQFQLNFETVELTTEERHVLSLLRKGRENARSVRFLAEMTSMKDVEIRQTVRHLIMEHGCLIASSVGSPPGFYIAGTEKEIKEATRSLRHRGIMILMRAAKLQKIGIEEIFNQARIEWDEKISAPGK